MPKRPVSTWSPSSTTDRRASTGCRCYWTPASAVGWRTSSRQAGPPPNLTTTEADVVTEQLAASGTHLVCLNAWQPGDGTPPAWWNDEEGAWMRQLDALREEERQQREQTSEHSQPGETGGVDQVGETGQPSDVNQTGRTGNASEHTETTKEVQHA